MPLKKSSEHVVEIQRKFRILWIELMIKRNLLDHKTLRKVLRLFTKLLSNIEHRLITPKESSIIHLIERSYCLFHSSWLEELKKPVQNKDKKSGEFSNNFMETLGTNLKSLSLIQRRKLLSLTTKISLTNTCSKLWTPKVKNSKI